MLLNPLPWSTEEFKGMPYKRLGKTLLKVSSIGLGTWKFGYPEKGDGSRVNLPESQEIFDKAYSLGITHWDTANRYNMGTGNSEKLIGHWLNKNKSLRRSIVLTTKFYGCMDGITPNHWGLSRNNVLDSVYASLERLKTDYIDIIYFHQLSDLESIDESLSAIEDLIRQDLVRYFAVSNTNLPNLKKLNSAVKKYGARLNITAVQNHFDIINGELEDKKGAFKYCQENGISFISWSPLVRGLLTDKYLDPKSVKKGDRLVDENTIKEDLTPRVIKKLQGLQKIAKSLSISVSNLVLSYMLTIKSIDTVIPSVSKISQLVSNARVVKIELNKSTIAKIKEVLL